MSKTKKTIKVTLTKEGAKCPNPATAKPLEYGQTYEVSDAPYWHRRIRDGVVKRVEETAPAPKEESGSEVKKTK